MERQLSQQRNRFHLKDGESRFLPKHRPLLVSARCHSSEQGRLVITQRRGRLIREDANKVPRNEKKILRKNLDSRRCVNDIFDFLEILIVVSGKPIGPNFKVHAFQEIE